MTTTTILGRTAILAALDLSSVDVDVPEWGGVIRVRMMTGTERDQFNASLGIENGGKPDLVNYRAKVVATTAVDGDGNRLFELTDAPLISQRSTVALERVFAAAARLNAMLGDSVEDATKNSEAATSGASS